MKGKIWRVRYSYCREDSEDLYIADDKSSDKEVESFLERNNYKLINKDALLTQEELMSSLPYGREFKVAVDSDGLIVQHPLEARAAIEEDLEILKKYADEINWHDEDLDNLLVSIPSTVTEESLICYLEEYA